MITVARLFVHPIKSAASLAVSQFDLDARGPCHDRRWLVVDRDGRFLTQRELPALGHITARPQPGGLLLGDGAGGELTVRTPPADAPRLVVTVWRDQIDARVATRAIEPSIHSEVPVERDQSDPSALGPTGGTAVGDWLSARLGQPVRLVYQGEEGHRGCRDHPEAEVTFADGFPLLLLSAGALRDLDHRLSDAGIASDGHEFGVEPRRFRPNIVIDGCLPHAEDGWQQLRIGAVRFSVARPCTRCVIPSLDPARLVPTDGFNRVLAQYRRRADAVEFGQNLIALDEGAIRVGDPVDVIA